jgi:hypothetical protein
MLINAIIFLRSVVCSFHIDYNYRSMAGIEALRSKASRYDRHLLFQRKKSPL